MRLPSFPKTREKKDYEVPLLEVGDCEGTSDSDHLPAARRWLHPPSANSGPSIRPGKETHTQVLTRVKETITNDTFPHDNQFHQLGRKLKVATHSSAWTGGTAIALLFAVIIFIYFDFQVPQLWATSLDKKNAPPDGHAGKQTQLDDVAFTAGLSGAGSIFFETLLAALAARWCYLRFDEPRLFKLGYKKFTQQVLENRRYNEFDPLHTLSAFEQHLTFLLNKRNGVLACAHLITNLHQYFIPGQFTVEDGAASHDSSPEAGGAAFNKKLQQLTSLEQKFDDIHARTNRPDSFNAVQHTAPPSLDFENFIALLIYHMRKSLSETRTSYNDRKRFLEQLINSPFYQAHEEKRNSSIAVYFNYSFHRPDDRALDEERSYDIETVKRLTMRDQKAVLECLQALRLDSATRFTATLFNSLPTGRRAMLFEQWNRESANILDNPGLSKAGLSKALTARLATA